MPLPKKGEAVPISKIKEICELTEIPPGYTGSILRARRHSSTWGTSFSPEIATTRVLQGYVPNINYLPKMGTPIASLSWGYQQVHRSPDARIWLTGKMARI